MRSRGGSGNGSSTDGRGAPDMQQQFRMRSHRTSVTAHSGPGDDVRGGSGTTAVADDLEPSSSMGSSGKLLDGDLESAREPRALAPGAKGVGKWKVLGLDPSPELLAISAGEWARPTGGRGRLHASSVQSGMGWGACSASQGAAPAHPN